MRPKAEFIAEIAAMLISGTTSSVADGVAKAQELIAAAEATQLKPTQLPSKEKK